MSVFLDLIATVPRPGHPHYRPASAYASALADLARRIREAVPVAGVVAVEAECIARAQLVDEVIDLLNVDEGAKEWWTIVAEERPGEVVPEFGGVWSTSYERAILDVVLWRPALDGRHLEHIAPDDGCRLHEQLTARRSAQLRATAIDASAVTLW